MNKACTLNYHNLQEKQSIRYVNYVNGQEKLVNMHYFARCETPAAKNQERISLWSTFCQNWPQLFDLPHAYICHWVPKCMSPWGIEILQILHHFFSFVSYCSAVREYTILRINIAKGTTDPRIEFLSQVQKQILVEILKMKFDQASTSKSQPNISLSIKLKLQNLDQN